MRSNSRVPAGKSGSLVAVSDTYFEIQQDDMEHHLPGLNKNLGVFIFASLVGSSMPVSIAMRLRVFDMSAPWNGRYKNPALT